MRIGPNGAGNQRVLQYLDPSGPIRLTNELDENWMAETKAAGLSAGSIIEVWKKNTSSSKLEVCLHGQGWIPSWGGGFQELGGGGVTMGREAATPHQHCPREYSAPPPHS